MSSPAESDARREEYPVRPGALPVNRFQSTVVGNGPARYSGIEAYPGFHPGEQTRVVPRRVSSLTAERVFILVNIPRQIRGGEQNTGYDGVSRTAA